MPVLSLIFSPVGRWLIIGAAVLTMLGTVALHFDRRGAARVQAEWNASREAARIEKVRLDNVAAENAAGRDAADTTAEAAADQSNTEARDAYVKTLEAGVCVLDAGTIDRLSNIK